MRARLGNRWRTVAVVAAVTVGAFPLFAAVGTAGPAGATTPVYYLALGDSLAYGTGATTTAQGYVNDIYEHEATRIAGLQLVNLGCPGATTTSMIDGPGCSAGTQLADAEAFLQAHPGQVAFATIDIGANDVDGCTDGTTIDESCVADGIDTVATNLPVILSGLAAAYPGLPVFGMNYYDPYLAVWLTGSSGQATAEESVTLLGDLNSTLAGDYAAAGDATVDVATAFQSTDFDTTGSWDGITLPQNVADICNWTNMCVAEDIHANDTGHALIAQTFEPTIDAAVAATTCDPPAITSAGSATATAGSPFDFTVTTCSALAPSFRGVHLPPGLAVVTSGGQGEITGTPAARDTGVYTATLTATVPHQTPATQTFTVTVDHAPVFKRKGTVTTATGRLLDEPVVTEDGYPVPTLATASTLPAGVTLTDGGDGDATLSGVPAAGTGGSYPVVVTATNGVGAPVAQTLTLVVDQAPAITSGTSVTATAGQGMEPFTVTATGYPAPTLRIRGLPAGVHLTDDGDGTATLDGTPTTVGTSTVTVIASGKAGLAEQVLTFTVTAGGAA